MPFQVGHKALDTSLGIDCYMDSSDSVARIFTRVNKLNHFRIQSLVIVLGEHTLDFNAANLFKKIKHHLFLNSEY